MNIREDFGLRRRLLAGAALAAAALAAGCAESMSGQASPSMAGVEVPNSINAMMVYLVDPMTHEIWDRNYVDAPLTDHDWMLVDQYANNLADSAVLVSMGGAGQADATWVRSPQWQQYAQDLQDGAAQAIAAYEAKDQSLLDAAGDAILMTCEGCHQAFKPDLPTEGIMHIPHGSPEYGG